MAGRCPITEKIQNMYGLTDKPGQNKISKEMIIDKFDEFAMKKDPRKKYISNVKHNQDYNKSQILEAMKFEKITLREHFETSKELIERFTLLEKTVELCTECGTRLFLKLGDITSDGMANSNNLKSSMIRVLQVADNQALKKILKDKEAENQALKKKLKDKEAENQALKNI